MFNPVLHIPNGNESNCREEIAKENKHMAEKSKRQQRTGEERSS